MATPENASQGPENQLRFQPLTPGNWPAFERLFGERGACANCWCMYYRLPRKEFEAGKSGHGNKEAMRALVAAGRPAGILAFQGNQAIAWCAFAPRKDFVRLANSRIHKPIDELPVWSIPCLFVDKRFRRRGLAVQLLRGVIQYAAEHGIDTLEAYPVIPSGDGLPDAFAWMGPYASFEKAGFIVVDSTSKNRPMVRYRMKK
jgi:GNAT superfamily N-acetyltransferase